MVDFNRQSTAPIRVKRSRRNHAVQVLTSMPAGKMVPVAAIPMLREDACIGAFNVAIEMMETKELLMNPVEVRLTAYVVPWLAMERFEGSMDQFNRSYMGQPQTEEGDVVDFFETHAFGSHGSNAVYKALGLHGGATELVNTMYLEAYNKVWNFRAKNRSKEITPRGRLTATLAPAFWPKNRFEHIVPDFDQAVIDGEIALNYVGGLTGKAVVNGIGWKASALPDFNGAGDTVRKADGTTEVTVATTGQRWTASSSGSANAMVKEKTVGGQPFPDVYADLGPFLADLAEEGFTISLSNIELARKTQAFAKLRQRYEGIDEEWVIDMLMSGLTIPDEHLKQPILLADKTVTIRQAKRYATDADNLAESAVSGGAQSSLRIRVPKLHTGGVIMVFAEAVPQQLFERQRDPFFSVSDVEELPEYLRDYLDPEKVDVVKNGDIDVSHGTPNGVFGYWPMNAKWTTWGPRVGGKFLRPTTDGATDTVRQRIWAIENVNPVLNADFYLVNNIHTKPFLDTASDPFEIAIAGNAVLEGNTVFGGLLIEATGNYDAVLEKAPQERISKS